MTQQKKWRFWRIVLLHEQSGKREREKGREREREREREKERARERKREREREKELERVFWYQFLSFDGVN
jgi:hypothetical protein